MDKNPDAFRTISEVADQLGLPQHVLRFWETRFKQIKPLKRGGGRRYYRPVDIELISGIKTLLYDRGYTIKGAQKLMKEQGVQYAMAIGRGEAPEPGSEIAAEEGAPQTTASSPVSEKLTRSDSEIADEPLGKIKDDRLSKDNKELLQEALFDLLECKRVLDQSRMDRPALTQPKQQVN